MFGSLESNNPILCLYFNICAMKINNGSWVNPELLFSHGTDYPEKGYAQGAQPPAHTLFRELPCLAE